MSQNSLSLHTLVVSAALLLSGCASIISGRTATVTIDSTPSNANVVIHDKHGKEVIATHTPARVELRRKDKYIWPAKYTATIDKPGYKTATVPIDSTVNPWVAGNIVLGGVVGLVVDNATGAAWKPSVAAIEQPLEPMYVAQQPAPSMLDSAPATYPAEGQQQVQPATAVY
jgi:uncharacterized protein YceK